MACTDALWRHTYSRLFGSCAYSRMLLWSYRDISVRFALGRCAYGCAATVIVSVLRHNDFAANIAILDVAN